MSFNFWERWPWTSFENLNLDWLMKAAKQAVDTANTAADSVGTFDARITANSEAIEQLGIDMETISSAVRVYVNNQHEAYYRGNHVTGLELLSMIQTHGDLPFVEYNGEVYMLDTVSNAGDLRFSMGHTVTGYNDLVIRHIMIPAQSSNAAYSITNVGSGGGGSNVVVFTITDNTCDHTYSELMSAWSAGKTLIAKTPTGNSAMVYHETVNQIDRITVIDPRFSMGASSFSIIGRYISSNDTVSYGRIVEGIATLDTIYTNAVTITPQTFSAAEKAIAKENIGIVDLPAVTTADNGKFLRVVGGAWAAATVPSAEITSFGP